MIRVCLTRETIDTGYLIQATIARQQARSTVCLQDHQRFVVFPISILFDY
jgi:hypothetical protein